jgi:hypothetical protein
MPDASDPARKSSAEERRERQAVALRENLRRRKEQARAQRDPDPAATPEPPATAD